MCTYIKTYLQGVLSYMLAKIEEIEKKKILKRDFLNILKMTFKFLLLLDLSWKILQTFFTCSPNGLLLKICGDFGKNALFDFYGQKTVKNGLTRSKWLCGHQFSAHKNWTEHFWENRRIFLIYVCYRNMPDHFLGIHLEEE